MLTGPDRKQGLTGPLPGAQVEGLAVLLCLLLQQALELQRAKGDAPGAAHAGAEGGPDAPANVDWPLQLAASLCQQVTYLLLVFLGGRTAS